MDTLLLVKNFTLSQTRDFYEVATFALLTLFLQKNAGLPISAPGQWILYFLSKILLCRKPAISTKSLHLLCSRFFFKKTLVFQFQHLGLKLGCKFTFSFE
ncbi:MAG: hypothetical protein ACJA1A_002862 [Saprospiraceae bacterium]|jgi:hypothetical protein